MVRLLESSATRCPPHSAIPCGPFNPEEMKALLIVAPVVALYSPIVLLPPFVTKIWARLVTGMRQSAATTAAKRTSVENLKILNEALVFMGLVLCGVFYRNSQSSLPVRVALAGV